MFKNCLTIKADLPDRDYIFENKQICNSTKVETSSCSHFGEVESRTQSCWVVIFL